MKSLSKKVKSICKVPQRLSLKRQISNDRSYKKGHSSRAFQMFIIGSNKAIFPSRGCVSASKPTVDVVVSHCFLLSFKPDLRKPRYIVEARCECQWCRPTTASVGTLKHTHHLRAKVLLQSLPLWTLKS